MTVIPKSPKFNSSKQEKQVAKEVGGRAVIASGSLWSCKGDVRNDLFLVECKTTKKDYYSLKVETWEKIAREAVKDGLRIPVLSIDLSDGAHRVAVMKAPPTLYDEDFVHATYGKSYRIREMHSKMSMVVSFDSFRLPNGRPLTLTVMPWNEFLEGSSVYHDF